MTQLTRYEAPEMDTMQLGQMLAKSGYFSDVREAAQAVVKVLAGREMGIGPIAAMTGIYIVKGRVTLSANLMAAQIKRSGKYTYSVVEMTNDRCELVFYEVRGNTSAEMGRSIFTKEDAQQAGLWNSSDPWKKTPRNMLFARAISNGAKWYCPDVFSGPVYTPDELTDEQAAVYTPPSEPTTMFEPPALPPPTNGNGERPLVKRLRELVVECRGAGVPVPELPKPRDMTDEALMAAIETLELEYSKAQQAAEKTHGVGEPVDIPL